MKYRATAGCHLKPKRSIGRDEVSSESGRIERYSEFCRMLVFFYHQDQCACFRLTVLISNIDFEYAKLRIALNHYGFQFEGLIRLQLDVELLRLVTARFDR